jgi:hypothetical protein
VKNLKYQYQNSIKRNPDDCFSKRYPNIKSLYYKAFSTHQERSFYFLHIIEYKDYPLKIRVARGNGLAQAWDDLPTYVYKVGSITPKESISITKSMSNNKKWESSSHFLALHFYQFKCCINQSHN